MLHSMLIYTLCCMFTYMLVNMRYKRLSRVCVKRGDGILLGCETPKKMPIWMMLVICAMFTYYNYYMTSTSVDMAGDRQNYLYDFEGGRESASTGLLGVMGLIYLVGGSFEHLLYVSSAVSLFFPLLAYRHSKEANPTTLLLFILSLYILVSFTALKQCYTNAFATLALVLMLQEKTTPKEIIIWVLMLLAMLFHPTGYILPPIYLYLRFFNGKVNITRLLITLFFVMLLFEPIMRLLGQVFGVFSFFSSKIDEYFGSDADKWEEHGIMSIFKGLPFYYISYLGLKWRSRIKNQIRNYDVFLLLSFICSFLFLMNIYNYWMSRFMYLFLFVVFLFLCQMSRHIPNSKFAILAVGFMTAVITYRELYLIYTLYGGI